MEQYQDEEATNMPQEICDISKYNHRNIIASKYVFEKKIGKGSFGCIYRGLNIITQEKVAIKYEATTCAQPTLLWESKILNHLLGIPGVVKPAAVVKVTYLNPNMKEITAMKRMICNTNTNMKTYTISITSMMF